jgi:hypothetical protein
MRNEQSATAPNLLGEVEYRFRLESWLALLAGGALLVTAGLMSAKHWRELLPQSSKLAKPVLGIYLVIAILPAFLPLFQLLVESTQSLVVTSIVMTVVAILLAIACRYFPRLIVALLLIMMLVTFNLSVISAVASIDSKESTLGPLVILALGLTHVSVIAVVLIAWYPQSPHFIRLSTLAVSILAAYLLLSGC